jgi:tellurite resistance protein
MSSALNPRLLALRDELQRRGQRRSMLFPTARPDVIETVTIVEEFGALCEVMFLVMVVEGKMLNVQRQLLRGALDLLSSGRVRTAHMEAMLDAASQRMLEDGIEARKTKVADALRDDPIRAETTLILATAVAAAPDGKISEAAQALLDQLSVEFDLGEERMSALLRELVGEAAGAKPPP